MKNLRQQKILEIISKFDIDTQEKLISKLNEEGYFATQTTISRDINQLKLVKAVTSDGKYKYIVPNVQTVNNKVVMNSAFTEAVVSVKIAQNIVVVKTLAGMANAVGVCIDSLSHDDIVGSVAGDDTIIIVTVDVLTAQKVEKHLKDAFKVV